MRLPSPAWMIVHAALALAALRSSAALASRHGAPAGLIMGFAAALLTLTFIASALDPRGRITDRPLSPFDYCSLVHRLPTRAHFAGTAVVLALCFAVCAPPLLSVYKAAWLACGLLTAHAVARPITYRSRSAER